MTPFIVDEEEEWEDGDDEAGDDEDHHHQAAVHHAAALQLHPGVEVHHWEILQTTLRRKLSIIPRQISQSMLDLKTFQSESSLFTLHTYNNMMNWTILRILK